MGLPDRRNEASRDQLDRLVGWLKESPIQALSGADAGGVFAWIDEATGQRPYLYSEITGYFMTLGSHLARVYPNDAGYWLERAKLAADWIMNVALRPNGALLSRKYPDRNAGARDMYSFENGVSAFFDCAMVGHGLLNVYGLTNEDRHLEAAIRLADFCLKAFESQDKRIRYALYDTRHSTPMKAEPRWSACWGPFEVKSVMFFHKLYLHTNIDAYLAFVERVSADALRAQTVVGGFGTGINPNIVHLHPHNYTVEGLLYLAAHGIRKDLRKAIHRAIDFTFATCLAGAGGALQQYSDNPAMRIPGIRSDVLAQSLRTFYIASIIDPQLEWLWESDVEKHLRVMDGFTLASGGTSYGEDENGRRHLHANAWCHFFNVEMRLYRQCYIGQARCTGGITIT
jgi:hypothetical protein